MGVIPNGASGYTPQVQGYAINGSGGENLRLEDRTEGAVKTHLEGTKGAENASGFSLFGGAIGGIIGGIFNGWWGGGSVGKPQEVQYTIEAIKDAVINGSTVVTVTSSGTRDIPDSVTECWALVCGGGENGANGSSTNTTNSVMSAGGRGGGYTAVPLDAEQVKGQTLSVVIGSNGGETSVSLGSTKLASMAPGRIGGIAAGVQGYSPTTSMPGDGGRGGYGAVSGGSGAHGGVAGENGTSSAVAVGGVGGAYTGAAGGLGTAGGNADPAANVKSCGAGGGGGGGGGPTIFPRGDGGSGGPGGYPGGGGGGGGSGYNGGLGGSGSQGAGGIGAPGIAWLVYK